MSKLVVTRLIGVLLVIAGTYYGMVGAKCFWRGTVLNPDQIVKKWGRIPLDTKTFSSGSPEPRAQMGSTLRMYLFIKTAAIKLDARGPNGPLDWGQHIRKNIV